MGSLAKSWVLEVGRVPYLLNCGRLSGKQVVGSFLSSDSS